MSRKNEYAIIDFKGVIKKIDHFTFTIKQLASICQVSTRTLRYYEELGLIKPNCLENNYRSYDIETLDRIEIINTLKQSGLTLHNQRFT